MKAMWAWKSSGDHSLTLYSPVPRGACIISMYFMARSPVRGGSFALRSSRGWRLHGVVGAGGAFSTCGAKSYPRPRRPSSSAVCPQPYSDITRALCSRVHGRTFRVARGWCRRESVVFDDDPPRFSALSPGLAVPLAPAAAVQGIPVLPFRAPGWTDEALRPSRAGGGDALRGRHWSPRPP